MTKKKLSSKISALFAKLDKYQSEEPVRRKNRIQALKYEIEEEALKKKLRRIKNDGNGNRERPEFL